jgi:hypothetical protein
MANELYVACLGAGPLTQPLPSNSDRCLTSRSANILKSPSTGSTTLLNFEDAPQIDNRYQRPIVESLSSCFHNVVVQTEPESASRRRL